MKTKCPNASTLISICTVFSPWTPQPVGPHFLLYGMCMQLHDTIMNQYCRDQLFHFYFSNKETLLSCYSICKLQIAGSYELNE